MDYAAGSELPPITSVAVPLWRTCTNPDNGKKYTAFVVEVHMPDGLRWEVERRYSDFLQLHRTLAPKYAAVSSLAFPQKKAFSSMSHGVIQKRQEAFEAYLGRLHTVLRPPPPALDAFLQVTVHVLRYSVIEQGTKDASRGSLVGMDPLVDASGAGVASCGEGGGGGGGGGGDGGGGGGGGSEPGSEPGSPSKPTKLSIDDFDLLKVVGKGSFGKVFLVRQKADRKLFAMKVLKKLEVQRRRQVEHTRTERRVMGQLDHVFIVPLRFAFQSTHKLYMVSDFCGGGELFFHLKRLRTFTEEMVRFYGAELLCALGHLHARDIIYRDLKPENILLDDEGHVRITDFGLCRDKAPDETSAQTFCGTPEYLAPEMILNRKDGKGYGRSVDWWAYGCLLYEMLTGWPPFYDSNLQEQCTKILRARVEFPPKFHVSRVTQHLLRSLLKREPAQRIGCFEAGAPVEAAAVSGSSTSDVVAAMAAAGEAPGPGQPGGSAATGEGSEAATPKSWLGGTADIMAHPFFAGGVLPDDAGRAAQSFPPMDWDVVEARGLSPPLVPKLRSDTDTNNFDREFTRMGVEESPEEETAFLSAEAQSALTPEAFSGFSYAPETPLGRVSAEEDAQRSQGGEGGGAAAAGSADEVLQAQLSQGLVLDGEVAPQEVQAPPAAPSE